MNGAFSVLGAKPKNLPLITLIELIILIGMCHSEARNLSI